MNPAIKQRGKYPRETDEVPSTSRPSFRSRDVILNVIARAKVGRTDPAGPLEDTSESLLRNSLVKLEPIHASLAAVVTFLPI